MTVSLVLRGLALDGLETRAGSVTSAPGSVLRSRQSISQNCQLDINALTAALVAIDLSAQAGSKANPLLSSLSPELLLLPSGS